MLHINNNNTDQYFNHALEEHFFKYRLEALEIGFSHVASSPLVPSSYHADKAMQ